MPTPSTPTLPLAGVRVLDFTRILAGPFCTMQLADMGADVIKVESFDGDDTRTWGPPFDAKGRSAYYLSINRNKRGIALDLKHPDGRQIAQQLAAQAHIVVENFRVGGMASFGLGFEDVRALNPAVVYASITGFGQTGPYAERPGYDFAIQAMSGLMAITGEPDGIPNKVGVAVSDVFAGMFATASILAALRHAEHTGIGQHLDINLLDSQIAALVNVASSVLVSDREAQRYGNAHPSIVPYQPFDAADGAFALAVGNDRQFAALCGLVGHRDWAHDPRFASNPMRVRHRVVLVDLLAAVFARHPVDHWIEQILAAGIPCGRINGVRAALNDPHIAARGLVWDVGTADAPLRMVGHAVGFSETPPSFRLPPPDLGEHTDAVLTERLALTPAALAHLRTNGAIR